MLTMHESVHDILIFILYEVPCRSLLMSIGDTDSNCGT